MSIVVSLSTLALRQVVDGACKAVGISKQGEAVVNFLTERFTDHSQRLTIALQGSNEKAWKALEIALAGDSLWDRCKVLISRSEDKAFAQRVRAFLDTTPLPELSGKAAFRQQCLEELRLARKANILSGDSLEPRKLAKQTAEFARFGDPVSLLDAEWTMIVGISNDIKQAGYKSLGWLLSQRPAQGLPILVVAVRYFFRRAVEEDPKLFQGLAFAKLEALGEAQEKGFAALSVALAQRGERLEELLGDVKAVVVQTHSAVLDLQGQISGQSEQIQQISKAVMKMLDQHQLQRRELRPADSMSIRGEGERKIVKQLLERYRGLPEGERQNAPALLNAVGKLKVVTGDFDSAQKDFQQVATLVADPSAQAEAHFNAFRTALERRDLTTALKELLNAVKLDAKRFAPFPVGKYHPQRILGAGGFGVAFSCRHKELKADVVVKTLTSDELDRDVDEVFNEARVLYQLEHPAIIRLLDCGYTIPADKARPYFVMNFFESVTLEEYVQKHGPLSPDDMIVVARQLAEGLQAAHRKGILHRDVKPANILVRKDDSGWQVKVIDFGLALKHKVVEGAASTAKNNRTLTGSSIAGTLEYAAPEQMGRLPGVAVGPYSDIYGWAKTCCFGLFKTTQPLPKHWNNLPESLAKMLEDCLEETPQKRPESFIKVLEGLSDLDPPATMNKGERGSSKIASKTAAKAAKQMDAEETPATTQQQPKVGQSGRHLWLLAAVLVVLMAVVGVGVIGIFFATRPGNHRETVLTDKKMDSQEKPKALVQLFNGKDLTGWKPSPGSTGNWKVENGILVGHCTGEYDYLFTERDDYKNYHLLVEAKIKGAQKGGTGQILLQSSFGPGRFPDGYMVNISTATGSKTGSLFANINGKWSSLSGVAKSSHVPDEWFRMEIIVKADSIFTKVNDRMEVDYTYTPMRYSKGRIAVGAVLTSEVQTPDPNTFLEIRKIEIKELLPTPGSDKPGSGISSLKKEPDDISKTKEKINQLKPVVWVGLSDKQFRMRLEITSKDDGSFTGDNYVLHEDGSIRSHWKAVGKIDKDTITFRSVETVKAGGLLPSAYVGKYSEKRIEGTWQVLDGNLLAGSKGPFYLEPEPPVDKNGVEWKTRFPPGAYVGFQVVGNGKAISEVEIRADGTYRRVLNKGKPSEGRFEFRDGSLIFSGGTGGGFIEVWSMDGDTIRLKLWYPASRYPDFAPNETGEMKRAS